LDEKRLRGDFLSHVRKEVARSRRDAALEQIHCRGETHRADNDAVAGVAADREEHDGDRADHDDGEPGALLESHAR